jgi:hypothetical protein
VTCSLKRTITSPERNTLLFSFGFMNRCWWRWGTVNEEVEGQKGKNKIKI